MLLCTQLVLQGHLRLYSLFSEKRIYERMRDLLDGSAAHKLDSSRLLDCVQQRSLSDLGAIIRVYVLHDASDIRKPNSSELEYLGTVMSLKKQVEKGYRSVNCVAIDPEKQGVHLLCHDLYSQNHPAYISQKELGIPENLSAAQKTLIAEDKHLNGMVLCKRQISTSHTLLQKDVSDRIVTHILDREYDSEDIFSHIDELQDEFVIRAKLSRVSDQGEKKFTPNGAVSKKLFYPRLVDKKLAYSGNYLIPKITIKNKTYQNAGCYFEWETLKIGEKTYTAVKITLKQGDKALFQHPMLLITNRKISTIEDAKNVYQAYILRFKIEVVFKFLKQNLGWETFQIRNFEAIKNLLALAFFLVGYFKELEEELKNHELAAFLCKIAYSKGKITPFFLLKGLEMLANYNEVIQWMKTENITQEQIQQLLDEVLN